VVVVVVVLLLLLLATAAGFPYRHFCIDYCSRRSQRETELRRRAELRRRGFDEFGS